MSTENQGQDEELGARVLSQYLLLNVEDIRLSDITNVRPFSSKLDVEKEIKDIQTLMSSIEQEGQLEPVIVMPVQDYIPGEPSFELLFGRRRLRAITLHNLASNEPMQVKAILGDPAEKRSSLFRRAAHENLMRAAINPIDMAYNIKTARENMKWKQAKDVAKLAEFFKVSEAQITQTEKLLDLDDEFQRAMVEGKLTREGAYALLKVKAGKRKDVFEAAGKKQKLELGELGIVNANASLDVEPTQPPTAGTPETAPKKKAKRSGAAASGGVKAGHVRQAAREADPESKQARTKKDIVEYFEAIQGPAYGYEDGEPRMFASNFIKWIKGEIQDRTLDKYWDALCTRASKGTPPPKVEKTTVTKAPGKTVTKAAKKK